MFIDCSSCPDLNAQRDHRPLHRVVLSFSQANLRVRVRVRVRITVTVMVTVRVRVGVGVGVRVRVRVRVRSSLTARPRCRAVHLVCDFAHVRLVF